MNRETHVRFCEGLGCNSLGLLTYRHSRLSALGKLELGVDIVTPGSELQAGLPQENGVEF